MGQETSHNLNWTSVCVVTTEVFWFAAGQWPELKHVIMTHPSTFQILGLQVCGNTVAKKQRDHNSF